MTAPHVNHILLANVGPAAQSGMGQNPGSGSHPNRPVNHYIRPDVSLGMNVCPRIDDRAGMYRHGGLVGLVGRAAFDRLTGFDLRLDRLARDAIGFVGPGAEIKRPAPVRAEGPKGLPCQETAWRQVGQVGMRGMRIPVLCRCGVRETKRATGLEPATSSLGSWHSTTELRPPGLHQQKTPGLVLLSHPQRGAVPSALEGLTAVFGMGTGVAPPPLRPGESMLKTYLTHLPSVSSPLLDSIFLSP